MQKNMPPNVSVENLQGLEHREILNSTVVYMFKNQKSQTIFCRGRKPNVRAILQYIIQILEDLTLPISIYRYKYMSDTVLL